jgi:hypothetical protein
LANIHYCLEEEEEDHKATESSKYKNYASGEGDNDDLNWFPVALRVLQNRQLRHEGHLAFCLLQCR